MTLREKQSKFCWMLGCLLLFAKDMGKPVVILEYYRTTERQAQLFNLGKSKVMHSKHMDGLAVDIAYLSDLQDDGVLNYTPEQYKILGEFWESLGGTWGGRWTTLVDAGHFES